MYIRHEGVADPDSSLGTAAIRNQHTDGEQVAFHPETGKANVKREIGEALADWHEQIVPVGDENADAGADAEANEADPKPEDSG